MNFKELTHTQQQKLNAIIEDAINTKNDDLTSTIELITDFFNEVNTLFKGKINFSYGRSQKLINVLLKYYWCANMLNGKEPAHMPIDSYILNALNIKDVCWTKMDFETYKDCIKVAKFIAEKAGKSLSEWELITFKEIMEK
jgi:hypothetical protein